MVMMMNSPVLLVILISSLTQSFGKEYIVGDTFWSIPTTNDFYTNWSSSQFFEIGDTFYFDFDSGLHNVMQVSSRQYQSCTADNPFEAFEDGPAKIVLMEEGVFYFICSISNHCGLGQKFSAVVHRGKISGPIPSPPGPSPASQHPLSSSSSENNFPYSSQQSPTGGEIDWSTNSSAVGGSNSKTNSGAAPLYC
ncbi:OLC1v1026447C1 [Oldenlandia corymbosa var. corymbosa]|uniref:OLC1v1026447C1 n=1 Tax=Oldenlandia corymbosa var. corymbosa TaxID=529605 RepID=A0AAV1C7U6_OLDCO|nr:OLC1v1026447C1 [Oldenlandia corymbosa var. corymbosa]